MNQPKPKCCDATVLTCGESLQADDLESSLGEKLHILSVLEPGDACDQAYDTLYHNKSGCSDLLSLNNGASRAFHKSLIGQ